MRYDVNYNGETHSFWNFQVEEGDKVTNYAPYLNLEEAMNGYRIYSVDEKVIGMWIDGRPLYSKTTIVSLAVGETVIASPSADLSYFTDVKGIVVYKNSDGYRRMASLTRSHYQQVANQTGWYWHEIDNTVRIEVGANFANSTEMKAYITFEYVKTTD